MNKNTNCNICGANHEKLGVLSCNLNQCRGELFYHICFKEEKTVMFDTRYDSLWNWGIVLDPMYAEEYSKDKYIWILTTDGENIVDWSRIYDYNFTKLFTSYSRNSYHKFDKNGKKIVNKLYSTPLLRKLPLIYDLHFYMIKKNRNYNDSLIRTMVDNSCEGGIGMYALVILQRFLLKKLKAKKHLKFKNYIYKIFEKGTIKDLDCITHSLSFI